MKLHTAIAASFFAFTVVSSLVTPAGAAPLTNEQANQQIDNAINTHYASADIDVAERKLLEIIKNCASSCSPAVLARGWMYVGIVRGGGRDDVKGAQEAFRTAKGLDPNVKLDEPFATDLVKRTFEQTAAGGGDMPLMGDIRTRVERPVGASSITCSLQVAEVETERPIPLSCRVGAGADQLLLSYKHEGAARWRQVPLVRHGDSFVGEIPCADTRDIGVLSYHLQALDTRGAPLDALGSEAEPLEVSLVQTTSAAPPALPGQPPPESCRPKQEPEPAGPKLGSYGDACSDASQCQGGLSCNAGKCAADVRCDSDSECFSGMCVDNLCVMPNEDCEGGDCPKGSRVPGNWFGLQGGLDFAMMTGSQVCSRDADAAYSCFEGGEPYRGLPNQNFAGTIDSGFRPATARVMLSYERVLGSVVSLEGRFGFAFNGGPESPNDVGGDGSKFLPFHAEGRVKIYFSRVFREDGSGLRGLGGFAMLGGGLAQVDPHVSVPVAECRLDTSYTPGPIVISQAEQTCIQSTNRALNIKDVEVYQRLGQGFVTGGFGLRYGITRHLAAVAALNAQFLLPSTGLTLSPSLGVGAGF